MPAAAYRFSLGPWNLGHGADLFGPPARPAGAFDEVLKVAVEPGFEGIHTASPQLLEAINAILSASPKARIAIEPKPNEPVDHAFIPTIGHALALGSRSADPARVGVLIESAHAILAGLDPSDEMGFALAAGKLWSVHLNDQNGLKFDQDKVFGAANLRGAFDQVRVLEQAGYAATGQFVGFDVKAQRTQKTEAATAHLATSKAVFLRLVEKARSFPEKTAAECIAARDYEALERLVLEHLLGGRIAEPFGQRAP